MNDKLVANELPIMDLNNSQTGCCPKFEPDKWDEKKFVFDNLLFAKASTKSFLFIPLNYGKVMTKSMRFIEASKAKDPDSNLILSHDVSRWRLDHYFKVSKEVAGMEMVRLSGTYITKVFDAPHKDIPKLIFKLEDYITEQGYQMTTRYSFYTTCPYCAETYGHNYIVLFGQIE